MTSDACAGDNLCEVSEIIDCDIDVRYRLSPTDNYRTPLLINIHKLTRPIFDFTK